MTRARNAAERAALAMQQREIKQRAALVGEAANSQEQVHVLIDQLRAALDIHEKAFRLALDGGWTTEQLRELADVVEDPRGIRRALRRLSAKPQATATAPADNGANADADELTADNEDRPDQSTTESMSPTA